MLQISSCGAKDIFDLNNSKEYTLIATKIAEKSLTDTRLTAGSAKLWQFLFGRSKYDKDLSIQISYSKLAYAFQKTARTISRWVKTLERAGYLLIQHNHDTKGNQIKNTLFVRIPHDVYIEAQETKDRTKTENIPKLKIADNFSETVISPEKENYVSELNEVLNKPSSTFSNPTCTFIQESTQYFPEIFLSAKTESFETQAAASYPGDTYSDRDDIFVMGRDDKNVLHKDISFKQVIMKNNNIENTEDPVVVSDENNKNMLSEEEGDIYTINREIASLKKQIADLDRSLDAVNRDASMPHKTDKLYTILCEIRETTAYIDFLENKKSQLLHEAEKKQGVKAVREDMAFMNKVKIKDGRAISPFTFRRLADALVNMGYEGQALNQLMNEILFEVRFGSLRVGKNGEILNQEKAVNIAIKLIREKRWTTPSELKAFIEKDLR